MTISKEKRNGALQFKRPLNTVKHQKLIAEPVKLDAEWELGGGILLKSPVEIRLQ